MSSHVDLGLCRISTSRLRLDHVLLPAWWGLKCFLLSLSVEINITHPFFAAS